MIKQRFLELDALRGIAALSVMFYHYTLGRPEAKWGFNMGCMGVELFFILSGFVIFMTITQIKDWKHFALYRIIRLYPAYWVSVSLTSLAIFALNIYDSQLYNTPLLYPYLINMTMFQHFFNVPNIDGSYWSLTVEILFYMMIGIFTLYFKFDLFRIFWVLVPFYILYFTTDFADTFFHSLFQLIPLFRYIPLFYAGIIFYFIRNNRNTIYMNSILLFSFLIQIFLYPTNYTHPDINHYQYIITLLIIYVVFYLAVFHQLKYLTHKILLGLGEMSYVIYLIHQFIGMAVLIPLFMNRVGLDYKVSFLLTVTVILSISYCITYYIDLPLRIYLKQKWGAIK